MKCAIHSGKLGDVVYSLPALAQVQGKLLLNSAVRRSEESPLTLEQAKQLAELVQAAGYPAAVWNGKQPFDVDLDEFRKAAAVDLTRHLVDCHWVVVSSLPSPRGPWLRLEPRRLAPVIINRTQRYAHNPDFAWGLLEGHDCVFVGMRDEWRAFCRDFFPVAYYPTSTLLELARIVAGAELFLGNQSFAFAIAEGLDLPRRLEVRPTHPCNDPRTHRGRTFLTRADFQIVSGEMGVLHAA
jgi:hypothetical protein